MFRGVGVWVGGGSGLGGTDGKWGGGGSSRVGGQGGCGRRSEVFVKIEKNVFRVRGLGVGLGGGGGGHGDVNEELKFL